MLSNDSGYVATKKADTTKDTKTTYTPTTVTRLTKGSDGKITTTSKSYDTTPVAKQTTSYAGVGGSANKIGNAATKALNSGAITQNQYNNVADSINQAYGSGLGTASNLLKSYTTPTYSGGGDDNSLSEYYQQLLALFEEQNEEARKSALNSIMANLNSVKGTYKNQIQSVYDEYNNLINENELKKERARQVVRENQANRGQLDSGLGRQEQLLLNSDYDNATTNLQSARTQAINDIYSLIAQAEAEAENNKATINNQYANALLQWKLANA